MDVILPAFTFTALQSALSTHSRTHFLHAETETKNTLSHSNLADNDGRCLFGEGSLVYLFIKGKEPSLLRLRLEAGAARFAGSENIILSMVHVVETFESNSSTIHVFNCTSVSYTAFYKEKGYKITPKCLILSLLMFLLMFNKNRQKMCMRTNTSKEE